MLYLLRTDGSMLWLNLPHTIRVDDLRTDGLDLQKVEWKPAEARVDDTTLRLALRNGVTDPRGIVTDGLTLAEHQQIASIREAHHKANAAQALLVNEDKLMESVEPGWTKRKVERGARIDQSTEDAIVRKQADVDRDLQQAPDAALIAHWEQIGGLLPDPA